MALLFIVFSKNLSSILLPESGESLFQVRVWKNHLQYCLLFSRNRSFSSFTLCVLVCVFKCGFLVAC